MIINWKSRRFSCHGKNTRARTGFMQAKRWNRISWSTRFNGSGFVGPRQCTKIKRVWIFTLKWFFANFSNMKETCYLIHLSFSSCIFVFLGIWGRPLRICELFVIQPIVFANLVVVIMVVGIESHRLIVVLVILHVTNSQMTWNWKINSLKINFWQSLEFCKAIRSGQWHLMRP